MTKFIPLLALFCLISCGEGNAPLGNNAGDRDPACESAFMCINKPGWLIKFRAPLPYNLALTINNVLVKDECKNGSQGEAIVDRGKDLIDIPSFFPPDRVNEIKLIDRGSNCLGKAVLMNRLTTGREIRRNNKKYFYFQTSF